MRGSTNAITYLLQGAKASAGGVLARTNWSGLVYCHPYLVGWRGLVRGQYREVRTMSYFLITSDGQDLCLNCGQWSEQEGVFIELKDRPEGIRCNQCKDYFNKIEREGVK